MRLEIKQKIDNPIEMPALSYLEATRYDVAAIHEQGFRHPLAMYNVSLNSVISSALELLDDLDRSMPLNGNSGADRFYSIETLPNKTKQLLLSNGEHIDACEKVIYSYMQTQDKGMIKKAKETLRRNLGWYEKHVLAQANHIKHRHSQVRNLCLFNQALAVPGYFIESSIGPDSVGPDPEIHRGNTAFSYARELKILVCGLIYISRSLELVLHSFVGAAKVTEPQDTPRFKDLIERVSKFPLAMFPDEYELAYPAVEYGDQFIKLSYGGSRTPYRPYVNIGFQTRTAGDGVTRSFQIPYMNGA